MVKTGAGSSFTASDGTAGRFDGAIEFSGGTGNYAMFDESGDSRLDVTKVTMTAWIYPTAKGNGGTIVSKDNSFRMILGNDGALKGQFTGQGDCGDDFGQVKIPFNAWSHVAVSFDGMQQNHFINGKWVLREKCSDLVTALNVNDDDVFIGATNRARHDFTVPPKWILSAPESFPGREGMSCVYVV